MGRVIETSIKIDAPPNVVWDHLTDFARMPEWNPFIRAISGPLQIGGRLAVRIAPPGKSEMTFKPTVIALRDARELRWLGRFLIPGLFDGEHYLLLAADGTDQTTTFTQGETFSGVLVGPLGGTLSATESGFKAMNEALKLRAEKSMSGVSRT